MKTAIHGYWGRKSLAAILPVLVLWAATRPAQAQRAPQRRQETAAERRARLELRASVERFRGRLEAILAGTAPSVVALNERRQRAGESAPVRPDKGHWAVVIADAATGQTLLAQNSQRYFTPASNTKLFTTALALAKLGPEHRFRTTIETTGSVDRFGRLLGDLVLVARGDPNLSNRKFPFLEKAERDGPPDKVLAVLADQVVARGIHHVEGSLVVNDGYFPPDRYPPGWAIDDMVAGYGAPVSALVVNDNTLAVEVRPGDQENDAAWFAVEPWADFYEFRNLVRTGAQGTRPRVAIAREPGSRMVTLEGTVPLGGSPQQATLAIEEPAEFAAALLKRLLEARGVRVYGRVRADHSPWTGEGASVLAEHTSPPLIEAVRLINKVSQNLHAEVLLRVVGRAETGEGTTEAGLRVARALLAEIGIADEDVVLFDGSGLSRRNLVTPEAVVKLLAWAAKQPWWEAYLATLPVAGVDGTLAERMKAGSPAQRIQGKTGSLGNVNSLSGFATTLSGKRLVFSIFGNHHNLRGPEATAVIDALCEAMVEEIGAPPPEKVKRQRR